jgi:hypothetical protein
MVAEHVCTAPARLEGFIALVGNGKKFYPAN